ncbi:class I SAM-dependent methyltransferase [Rhizobium sp. G187]|uniref:class I SAM-dependent methyltransferase n=1 Tax=Rhizobium sp. G187 TaxID=3451352 RepID=UPI003EE65C08
MRIDEATYENVPGNYYDKYNTKNPIARYLMDGFLRSFDELTALSRSKRSYEVGCGEGNLSLRLRERGWEVRGSDLETVSVDEANMACAARNYPPLFYQRSLFDLTPEEAACELVICCEVLEHVPDTHRALETLRNLATPYLLVSVPREPVWRVLNMARGKYLQDLGNTPGHIHHWSSRTFIKEIEKIGDIVSIKQPLPWTMVLCRCD